MLELAGLFPAEHFDVVLCNGVFGFGVDTPAAQTRAWEAMAAVLKPGGLLLLGWNTDRIDDPLSPNLAGRWFEPCRFPELESRRIVEGCTHVYDFLQRRRSAAISV